MSKNADRALRVSELGARGASTGARAGVMPFERWALRSLFAALERPRFSVVLWNAEEIAPAGVPVSDRVHVHSRRALYTLLRNPREHFGDLYAAGEIEIEGELPDFLERLFAVMPRGGGQGRGPWRLWRDHRPRATDQGSARQNIQHHYDLGNAFYELWLDTAAMQYTCAYYPAAELSLEEAQTAKMHHVCRKLRLRPDHTVVEAGCGWGGLARFMAREYGVRVRAFNISTEQVRFAREKARAEGLHGRVEYVEDDYRNVTGRYDAFVSVGMLEHVGTTHYADLSEVIHRTLEPEGLGLIHTIGRNRPALMNGWIERRIFPGAYPPALSEMMPIFETHRFSVLDVENLRLHYARTLEDWLVRFTAQEDAVRAMYDETFVRTWRLYLAGSIAAFRVGSLQLFQVLFAHERSNAVPWTRADIYGA